MLLVVGQMAGPIWTKLGTWTRLEPGSVLAKSSSRCERHGLGMRMEAPFLFLEDRCYD